VDRFACDSPEYTAYLQENAHERGEICFLQAVAREGMIAVDAGGHFGLAACAISRAVGESGRLYCFEPIPEYREILGDNLARNALGNVEVVPAALGREAGRTLMYKDGGSTGIVPRPDREALEADVVQLDRFLGERGLDRLDLLNMDCEGSELLVLQGAQEHMEKNPVHVFVEVHHEFLKALDQSVHDLLGFLRGAGCSVSTVALSDLKLGEDWDTCEYLYARRQAGA
jgi:FkbM family methyltransferase